MTVTHPQIDPKAAALLRRRLEPGETLVWAERPSMWRVAVSSVRSFIAHPLHWGGALVLVALVVWRTIDSEPVEILTTKWTISVVAVALAGPLLIDLACSVLLFLPCFTPLAYGATSGYFLIMRGPFFPRLLRTPTSIIKDLRLVPWGGHTAILFDMHGDQLASFSFLHANEPSTSFDALHPLVITPEHKS